MKIKKFLENISSKLYMICIIILVTIILLEINGIVPMLSVGASMQPTCKNISFSILNNKKNISRQDIVCVYYNGIYAKKRVIAMPNDIIEIKNGIVYINDDAIYEPYIIPFAEDNMYEYKVPEDKYFLIGDNRPESIDSRSWGAVPVEDIRGVVVFNLM